MADLTAVAITQYKTAMKVAYNSKGNLLKDTIYTKYGVIGSQVQFDKVGQLIARDTYDGEYAVFQDPGYSKVFAPMQARSIVTRAGDIAQLTVDFSERMESANLAAQGLRRKMDQVVIDALNASGTTNTIAVDYASSSGNTNITQAKIAKVTEFFMDKGIPEENRYMAIGASQAKELFGIDTFARNNYTNIAPNLVTSGSINGSLNYGMKFIMIPTMPEGGLPKSGNIRTCFAWHYDAIGLGVSKEPSTIITWENLYTSYVINSWMVAGAVARDAEGIITIACDETA